MIELNKMKRISSVVSLPFLVLLLLVIPVNGSSDWMEYSRDIHGNVHFYKKVMVENNKGKHIVQVWEKNVLSDKSRETIIKYKIKHGLSTEGYDKLSCEMCLLEIDCKQQKYNLLSYFYVDTDEKFLHSNDLRDKSDLRDIVPNSRVDVLQKKVCK